MTEPRRDPDLYLDDGNIVILATGGGDDEPTIFRVHRSVLSRHSDVFRAMFTLPATHDMELYDGTPVVRFPDDAKDVGAFLRFLYDPCFLPLVKHHPKTAGIVYGPLKLADKYQCDSLRARMVERLTLDWWTTLEERIRLSDELAERFLSAGHAASSAFLVPDPAIVLRLARDCDIKSIFPAVYLRLCAIPMDSISDKSQTTSDMHTRTQSARWDLLDQEEISQVTRGRQRISQWIKDAPLVWPRRCCKKTGSLMWRILWENCSVSYRVLAKLDNLPYPDRGYGDKDLAAQVRKMCAGCRTLLDSEVTRLRKDFVGKISYFFELDQPNSIGPDRDSRLPLYNRPVGRAVGRVHVV